MCPPGDAQENSAVGLTPPVVAAAPWRVREAVALPGFRLRVRFNDGTVGEVDLGSLLQSADPGVFSILRDENKFREVRVSLGAVSWPGDLDLAPDAMYSSIKQTGYWKPEG